MWKNESGRLIHMTDYTRMEYKTRISAALIVELKEMATENNSHIAYLLENGYENILKEGTIVFDKKKRPKDRVDFLTTCNKELLQQLKLFAKEQKLNLNDVIEGSTAFIDPGQAKPANWRYRTE